MTKDTPELSEYGKNFMREYAKSKADPNRIQKHGENLFAMAKKHGWDDDGEGPLEFLMRKAYETGHEDNADGGRKHGN